MSRSYKNTVIAVLLACILTMAIGYAVLNTRLSISGTSNITSDFNIQVVDINEILVLQLAETADMSFTPTSATYSANLQAPGDGALYEIVIENKGSLSGYVEIAGDGRNIDYGDYNGDFVSLGIIYGSKVKLDINDINFNNQLYSGVNILNPGEKLYFYAQAIFNPNATSMPSQKSYSNVVNFNFYTRDQYPEDTIIKDRLLASILNNETIVTEGAGLYYYTNANQRVAVETNEIYSYKSDAYSNVNNYVNINDKLWRIIRANYNVDRGSYSYELIEDEMTNNVISGYSTISDSNGYYNSLFDSTLVNTVGNSIYYQTPFSYYYTPYYPIYVESGDLLSDYSEEHFKPTIEVFDVFHASTDVNCSYSTLATGGCQSWLTNNGNTFLASKVYSDESTNTGKIAYLKDGKVIAVDPQDTNYGNYKTFYFTGQDCDFLVLNAGVADGSRNNPYTISTSCSDLCSCDV